MKLTNRERTLLILLFGVIFIIGYWRFVLGPQFEKIDGFKENILLYQDEIHRNDEILSLEETIDVAYDKVNSDILTMGKNLFSSLKQDYLILLLNDLIDQAAIEVPSISFSAVRGEELSGTKMDVITVTLPFDGTYTSLLNLLKEIRQYDKKIIVQQLNINSGENDFLSGSMLLDFYGLPTKIGSSDSITAYLEDIKIKDNPFSPYEGYDEFLSDGWDGGNSPDGGANPSSVNITIGPSKVILYDFETQSYHFKRSSSGVTGRVLKDTVRKEGLFSGGIEYSFSTESGSKSASIILDNKIKITKNPQKIGLWIYTTENLAHGINLNVIDGHRKKQSIPLVTQVNWLGWNYVSIPAPSQLYYPITIESISVETTNSYVKQNHTLLFDKLEAIYQMAVPDRYEFVSSISQTNPSIEPINVNPDTNNRPGEYVVQRGDTIFSITKKFYQDYTKRNLIIEQNNIQYPYTIKVGQTLTIPKE